MEKARSLTEGVDPEKGTGYNYMRKMNRFIYNNETRARAENGKAIVFCSSFSINGSPRGISKSFCFVSLRSVGLSLQQPLRNAIDG